MDILHLGSADIGNIGKSGVSAAVLGYAVAQAAPSNNITIASTADLPDINGVNVKNFSYSLLLGKKIQFSYELINYINDQAQFDIIHNHGLWRFPNTLKGRGKNNVAKLVSSPHGVLSTWAMNHKKFEKQIMLKFLGQRRMLENIDLFHATSLEELYQIRMQNLWQPVMVVENGVNIPIIDQYHKHRQRRTVLFMGRIHPIKGLDFLLESWLQIGAKHSEWQLIIAGPIIDSIYEKSLRSFISNNHIRNVKFIGPVIGAEKEKLLAESDCLVLTSHSENFAIVVAEALAHGTPVLVTEGSPWGVINTFDCGWYVPRNIESFNTALLEVLSSSPDITYKKGYNGRAFISQNLSWPIVSRKLISGYKWIIDGGQKPDFIYQD